MNVHLGDNVRSRQLRGELCRGSFWHLKHVQKQIVLAVFMTLEGLEIIVTYTCELLYFVVAELNFIESD